MYTKLNTNIVFLHHHIDVLFIKNTRGLTPIIFKKIRRFHLAPPPDPHLNNNSNNNNKNADNDMNNDNNNLICTPNTNMYTNIYS